MEPTLVCRSCNEQRLFAKGGERFKDSLRCVRCKAALLVSKRFGSEFSVLAVGPDVFITGADVLCSIRPGSSAWGEDRDKAEGKPPGGGPWRRGSVTVK